MSQLSSQNTRIASLSQDLRNPTLVSFLDFSRWIAAAIVFVGHLRNPLFLGYSELAPQDRTMLVKAWYFVTGLHAEAVIVFFVLSGLLVAGVGVERIMASTFDVKNYAVDRFSRLYIAFLPALVVCYLMDILGSNWLGSVGYWDHTQPMIAQKVASEPFETQLSFATLGMNCLMLQSYWWNPLGSNQPLWTISTEFWFYVAFGIAGVLIMAKNWKRWMAAAIFLGLFFFLGSEFLILIGYWLVGMMIVFIPRLGKWSFLPAAVVFSGLLVGARVWQADFDQSMLYRTLKDYTVAIAFAILIASMRGADIGFFKFTAKVNKFFADFSYSLYLLHFPTMLFLLALIYFGFHLEGIATGYSPISLEGRAIYVVVIIAVYVLAWGFSRLTEAKTASVRRYLKSLFQKAEVVHVH